MFFSKHRCTAYIVSCVGERVKTGQEKGRGREWADWENMVQRRFGLVACLRRIMSRRADVTRLHGL